MSGSTIQIPALRQQPVGDILPPRHELRLLRPEKKRLDELAIVGLIGRITFDGQLSTKIFISFDPGFSLAMRDLEIRLRGYLECGLLCFGFARALCLQSGKPCGPQKARCKPGARSTRLTSRSSAR